MSTIPASTDGLATPLDEAINDAVVRGVSDAQMIKAITDLIAVGDVEWRDVEGYPGYQVSSDGRVLGPLGRVLRPWRSGNRSKRNDYLVITVGSRSDGTVATKRVSVLVCTAFHGPRPTSRHEVAHNDGDRFNNRAENLRWATHAENEADKLAHGTRPDVEVRTRAIRKISDNDVRTIRLRYRPRRRGDPGTAAELAHEFGTTRDHITDIAKGRARTNVQ